MFRPLRDLVDQDGFWPSVAVGALLAVACAAAWRTTARRHPLRVVAGLYAIAVLLMALIVDGWFDEAGSMIVATPMLFLAGIASAGVPRFWGRVAIAVPGAAVVALGVAGAVQDGLDVALFVAIALSAAALMAWPSWQVAQGAGLTLLVISIAGVYVCVPDTEHAAVALAVVLPALLLGVPLGAGELGRGGGAAWVGVIGWLAGSDGAARPGAVVGAIASLGVLVMVPLLERWPGTVRAGLSPVAQRWLLVAVQFAVVLGCSRLAGLRESALASAGLAAVFLVGGFAVMRIAFTLPSRHDGDLS